LSAGIADLQIALARAFFELNCPAKTQFLFVQQSKEGPVSILLDCTPFVTSWGEVIVTHFRLAFHK